MDKFNLTFNGEILPGQNLAEVKVRFAEILSIDDPDRVELFFSGKVATLRRNLDKDTAEAFYTRMHRAGAILKLETVPKEAKAPRPKAGMDREFHSGHSGNVEQSWPIKSSSNKKTSAASTGNKRGNAVTQAQEQQKKKAAALEEKKRLEAEAAHKKAAEDAARQRAEQKRKYEEEVAQAKAKEEARKKALAEAAREKAAEEEARKKVAEEAARKKATEEEARKKAAEKAARKAARKKAAEEVARKKAAEEEARRKAAEEAARKKAAEEEARRKAAEEAARKKAAEEEARRKAAEEAARKKAAEEEARKKAAEEAARKKAAEEKAREKAAEEAAKKKAAEEEARRKAAEEAARKKAAEEEARKKAAVEAARKKAAEKEARRKAAEEATRKKAAEEEARKKAAVEAARKKAAEEKARKKAAEKAVRKKAAEEESRRKADEKADRLRAELAEQKRRHAEEAARAKADEQRIEDELRALAIARQAEEAAQAAELKKKNAAAEKQKKQEEAARLQREKQAAEKASRERAEEQRREQASLDRAAEGTARLEQLQKLANTSKKSPASPSGALPQGRPKCQSGAPNLFSLRPFRNTAEIRQRAEQSQQLMKKMFIASVAAMAALLILGTRYALLPEPAPPVSGAEGIVVSQHSGLILVAGKQLFALDRSGVDTNSYALSDLGINTPINLLGFSASGELLLQEMLDAASNTDPNAANSGENTWRTLKCNLDTTQCLPYAEGLVQERVSSWIVDSRTGQVFLATPTKSLLSKLAEDGTLIAQAEVNMPAQATLALHEGLLYMNSAVGPGISIFRPDNKGFGQQLDEVLLLPPPALEKGQTLVGKFVYSEGNWWVTLSNPETREVGLYRFDPKWNFIGEVPLLNGSYPGQLVSWASKILLLDSEKLAIQRFNSMGVTEAPLIPASLKTYIETDQISGRLSKRLWHVSLGILALLGIATYLLGHMHQLRSLVYKKDKVRGAEPVDDKEKLIHWVGLTDNRNASFRTVAAAYGLFGLAVLGTSIFLALPVTISLATGLILLGPGIALALLWAGRNGHIGVFKDHLILVDQHNMYHVGSGPRVHYRNNFLLLDDVVVFIGSRRLPVFSTEQLAKQIVPMALAGVKVDRKTVAIKLIQSGHPIAKGLYACAACLAAATICLLFY